MCAATAYAGNTLTIVIHVGADEFVRDLDLDVDDLDVDGYTIAFPAAGDIVILGATDWGGRTNGTVPDWRNCTKA